MSPRKGTLDNWVVSLNSYTPPITTVWPSSTNTAVLTSRLAICGTGAVETLPPRFLEWLKPGGRLFAVRGHSPAMEAVLVHREVNGLRTESLFETDLPYLAGAAPQPAFAL